ncbi:MAG TPA: ABC transporter ATP-binding protein [Longimicrobium sp.]|nr:ABC transporter ATP-binding protein [Longimicrobium sp.]
MATETMETRVMRPAGTAAGQRGRISPGSWREARALVWKHRRTLAVGAVLLLVGRVAGLVLPASSKYLVDEVLAAGRASLLPWLAAAAALATVVQAATGLALARVVSVAGQRAITDLRRAVLAHVLRLPVREFDATRTGVLAARVMNDPDGVRTLVGSGLLQLAGGLLSSVLALGVLLWLNWALTLGILALLLGFAGAMAACFRRLRPLYRERGKLTAEVNGRLTEALAGIRVVKTYGKERREERAFARGVHRVLRTVCRALLLNAGMMSLSSLVIGGAGVLIMVAGGRAVLSGAMTLGDLVMYIFFVGLMVGPLIQVSAIGTQVTEAFAGLDRVREVREKPTEDQANPGAEPVRALAGEVVFDDVSFGYTADEPVLRNLSFRAAPGTTTALVGPSGAGKSTLIGLVMGFHAPSGGRVLVDGRDLTRLSPAEYRRHLGVVLQDNFLFDGTLRENIAYARPGATDREVMRAARLARCDEFVDRFPRGLDTVVGERGVKLSGGQRQRVAIARALLADPRILILDEATSSLDSESEALIQEGLQSLREGRTTFVIAHRLSTIRGADQILVLGEGRIVQRGTHDELMAADGLYRRLYERQARVDGDRFANPGEAPPEPQRRRAAPPALASAPAL